MSTEGAFQIMFRFAVMDMDPDSRSCAARASYQDDGERGDASQRA